MLEPLFRCNLACAGCGKMQYPPHILKKELTPEECFAAVEECGTPMVSIPGGEPLLHPQIVGDCERAGGAEEVHLPVHQCAAELKKRLHEFTPSKYLTFSVHLDGQREHHDFSVCREGGYDIAVEGIKEAVKRGLPRDDEYDVLRWHRSEQRARALRRDDGDGRRGHGAVAGLHLRQGAGPEALLGRARVAEAVPRDSVEPEEDVEVQYVAAVSRVPDGRPQLRVHAVGYRRLTTSSAGRSLATCCRMATRTPSRS